MHIRSAPHKQFAALVSLAAAFMTGGHLAAQTLANIGSAAPNPGANDIGQLATSSTAWPDGLNYFTDNNPIAGQTFTTGSSAMTLVSLAVKTAGVNSGGGYGTPETTPTYYLRIYSISGSTATLLNTFSSPNPGYTDGNWLKWSGLNIPLQANRTYAFSFGVKPDNGGWAALSVAANAYAGGEIALIPINGGTITTGASHSFDATFALGLQTPAPTISEQIIVDQFGWRANAPRKVAIFSDPIDGQNSAVSYTPGASFQLRRVSDDAIIFTGSTTSWNGGATDAVSGDKVWYGDFSSVTTPGEYYIHDPANNLRSFAFKLDNSVFNDVLKALIRMFYYQRTGTSIPAQYGGNWTRGLTHVGPGQDNEALLVQGDNPVPGTQRDVTGGWFDAGDFNKYVPFTPILMWDLMTAYEWNPTAFNDSYNIPESGNGVPDALDEIKWCLDWLLKMQLTNGSVLNRVGDRDGNRYYTPATTWATAGFAATMAQASRVFAPFDSAYPGYSATLLNAATNAWNYLLATPNMTPASGSDGANNVAVATATSSADGDFRLRVFAAAELWRTTGNATYKTYFETNYNAPGSYAGTSHPLYGGWPHFDPTGFMELNRAFVTYATTPGANPAIIGEINASLYTMTSTISGNYTSNDRHAYRSYVWSYFWGSNAVKSQWANLLTFAIKLNLGTEAERTLYREIAEEYVHYVHGRNPLSQLYLSNMGTKGANIGGDKSAMEIWHGAFPDGSAYDGLNSTFGPAPGFLVGGANQYYTGTLSPPASQPPSKSFFDWNSDWQTSPWEITEPSIGYQAAYCLLLSQFAVTSNTPAPNGLSASTVSSSQINLSWSASSGATSYNVKRATVNGGPYTTVQTGVTGTSFTNTGLSAGTTYYYVVSAVGTGGQSVNSTQASATTSSLGALPSGWSGGDVGSVAAAGSAGYSNGVYTVNGSGADIWGTADEFNFVRQQITGDCDIRVRVASLGNTHGSAKAGVMIRESLNANSAHALVNVTPSVGVEFIRRTTTGGSSSVTSNTGIAAPHWVRLVRSGNTFTAYRSADGVTWTTIGSETIAMGATVYAGLAVTSHNDGVLAPATVDNVSLTALPSPWQTGDIGAVGATGSATQTNGTFIVNGSGADIWDTADEFRYVYQTASGDCELVARVTAVGNTNGWAKAGVMIRESLNANSSHAMVVVTPGNGVSFQRRGSTGGTSSHTTTAGLSAPYWVRIVRSGSTFTAYRSTDGTNWTTIGSQTITMSSTVTIGLVVTSHADGTLCTTTFSNVTATP